MEGGGNGYKKGLWTEEEDRILMDYIKLHGKGNWNRLAKATGLKRCGKSCRLRWMNYLSPTVKRGDFSEEEEDLIIRLHKLLGNRWSLIAGRVPGRTDNQVKNHWNTHLSRKLGVKKERNKLAISSSTKAKVLENDTGRVTDSDSLLPLNCKVEVNDKKASKDDSQGTIGFNSTSELACTLIDDYENFFWFSDDGIDFPNPRFMELLDESLDFVWHGL